MNKNIQDILQRETQRQDTTIELIASENFASDEVMDCLLYTSDAADD